MPSYIYNATTKELENVAGGTLFADMPIGTIVPFGGSVIPDDYKLCDGSELLKTEYADLYAVIGDAFGTASANTKFKLPDLREAVPVGSGTRGSGVSVHDTYTVGQFKDDQMQNVNGGFCAYSFGNGSASGAFSSIIDNPNLLAGGSSASYNYDIFQFNLANVARTGTTTHGKQLGVNFIIKAKQSALPLEFEDVLDDYVKKTDVQSSPISGNDNPISSGGVYTALGDKDDKPTVLTQTLTAGATSLTFTDASIGNNSRIIIYTNPYSQGVVTGATQSGTSVTVTCAAQSSAYDICIEIRN